MPEIWFAVPGDLATPTGGYAYARRLIAELPEAGWQPRHLPLPDDSGAVERALESVPRHSIVLVDGLAFGVLPREMLDRLGHRWVALVHHPLAFESGLEPLVAARLCKTEREALEVARAVIATSAHTADQLAAEFGVARERLHVAEPGTDRPSRSRGSGTAPCLLCVATVTARKAHDVLIAALARLSGWAWRCRIVGSLDRDPDTAARVAALVRDFGLADRVTLEGELAAGDLEAAYQGGDVFVLPSRYEGYGMAFAEAMAHGLPVVACAVGAVPWTVPARAGLLVAPDDPEALAGALERLLADPELRRRLADGAWAHGAVLPTWKDTAAAVARALNGVTS